MTTLTTEATARNGQAKHQPPNAGYRDLVARLHTLADQLLALSQDRAEQRAKIGANFPGGIHAGEANAYEVAAIGIRNELDGGPGLPPGCTEAAPQSWLTHTANEFDRIAKEHDALIDGETDPFIRGLQTGANSIRRALVGLAGACSECAGRQCVPADDSPAAAPVPCPVCLVKVPPPAPKPSPIKRPVRTYRSLADAMHNAPEMFADDADREPVIVNDEPDQAA
jgi:hypothetical protein